MNSRRIFEYLKSAFHKLYFPNFSIFTKVQGGPQSVLKDWGLLFRNCFYLYEAPVTVISTPRSTLKKLSPPLFPNNFSNILSPPRHRNLFARRIKN